MNQTRRGFLSCAGACSAVQCSAVPCNHNESINSINSIKRKYVSKNSQAGHAYPLERTLMVGATSLPPTPQRGSGGERGLISGLERVFR